MVQSWWIQDGVPKHGLVYSMITLIWIPNSRPIRLSFQYIQRGQRNTTSCCCSLRWCNYLTNEHRKHLCWHLLEPNIWGGRRNGGTPCTLLTSSYLPPPKATGLHGSSHWSRSAGSGSRTELSRTLFCRGQDMLSSRNTLIEEPYIHGLIIKQVYELDMIL